MAKKDMSETQFQLPRHERVTMNRHHESGTVRHECPICHRIFISKESQPNMTWLGDDRYCDGGMTEYEIYISAAHYCYRKGAYSVLFGTSETPWVVIDKAKDLGWKGAISELSALVQEAEYQVSVGHIVKLPT